MPRSWLCSSVGLKGSKAVVVEEEGSAGSEEKERRGCWERRPAMLGVDVGVRRAGRCRRRTGVPGAEEEEENAAARVVMAVAVALVWRWTKRATARRRRWMKACILGRWA